MLSVVERFNPIPSTNKGVRGESYLSSYRTLRRCFLHIAHYLAMLPWSWATKGIGSLILKLQKLFVDFRLLYRFGVLTSAT